MTQKVASEYLAKTGVQVTLAENGLQAVNRINSGNFDLVLMDVQMPEMDGLQATRLIRTLVQGQRLPIVAMTASALEEDRRLCLAAGMDDYLSKPIDPMKLLRVMMVYLTTSHSRRWLRCTGAAR